MFLLPASTARDSVVSAFALVGLPLSPVLTTATEVVWDSGMNDSGAGYKQRIIRANLIPAGMDTTRVVLTATERTAMALGGEQINHLTSRAGGYGFKVWCAFTQIADTLRRSSLQ